MKDESEKSYTVSEDEPEENETSKEKATREIRKSHRLAKKEE